MGGCVLGASGGVCAGTPILKHTPNREMSNSLLSSSSRDTAR